jgi:hypothetical protein
MSTVEVSKSKTTLVEVTRTKNVTTVEQGPSEVIEIRDPGVAGPANVLTVGTVTSGEAAVTITGTAPNQTLNFVLPTGGSYIHTQSTASPTWTITHNLGYYPAVSVVDSGDNHVIGDVNYVSINTVSVSFSASFGGKAYLS